MIGNIELGLLLKKYGIDVNKLKLKNDNIFSNGDYHQIEITLNYLINTLKVSPSNIEKCPSILYFNPSEIKNNIDFLKDKVKFSSIETCLHVLSTDNEKLRETYYYVLEKCDDEVGLDIKPSMGLETVTESNDCNEIDAKLFFLNKLRNSAVHFRMEPIYTQDGKIVDDMVSLYDQENNETEPNVRMNIRVNDLVHITREVEKVMIQNSGYNNVSNLAYGINNSTSGNSK